MTEKDQIELIRRELLGQEFKLKDLRNYCEGNDKSLASQRKDLEKLGVRLSSFERSTKGNDDSIHYIFQRIDDINKKLQDLEYAICLNSTALREIRSLVQGDPLISREQIVRQIKSLVHALEDK